MQRPIDGHAMVEARPAVAPRNELLVFLLLAVVVWPVLTVGVVGGYGFAVWMQQQIFGPPVASASHGH